MRQWAELLRMKPYEDNGEHELLISVGGSNGQASRFALHIQETLASKTSRWNWTLSVKPLDKATSEQQAKKVSEETAALLDKLHTALHNVGEKGATAHQLAQVISGGKDAIAKRLIQLREAGRAKVIGESSRGAFIWQSTSWDAPVGCH